MSSIPPPESNDRSSTSASTTPWLIRTHYTDYRLLNLVVGLSTLGDVPMVQNTDALPKNASYYVPVKVPSIVSFGELEELRSGALDSFRDDPRAILVFDLSIEAITFDGYTDQQFIKFLLDLQSRGFPPDRIWLLNTNFNSRTVFALRYADLATIFPIRIIGYDFHLFELCWELHLAKLLDQPYDRYLEKIRHGLNADELRPRHFMCLNVRPRWHRWAVILHLAERGLFEKGDITFFGDSFGADDVPGVEDDNDMRSMIEALPSGRRLLPHVDEIRARSPITLTVGPEQIRKMVYTRDWGDPSFVFAEGMGRDGPNLPRCYFEIVNETWLTGPECIYITEKTVRPLVSARPFILIGNAGALRHLRDLGFRTFAPFFDESYDEIDSPIPRLEAIFAEIDRLCALSIEELHKITTDLWPVLEHNARHFQKTLAGRFLDHFAAQSQSRSMQKFSEWAPWTK